MLRVSNPEAYPAQVVIQRRKMARNTEMLLGLITGMVADGHLNDHEVSFLRTWLAENKDTTTVWPGSFVAEKLNTALADGRLDDAERLHLCQSLQKLIANDFAESGSTSPDVIGLPYDLECAVILQDRNVCLSGDFLFGTRAQCELVTASAGANLRSTVSRLTHYLVIGTHVSPSWVHTSFGRKIQQAMELQQTGAPIKIISEERWHKALG
jgi:NAD-dependent DNA ligase